MPTLRLFFATLFILAGCETSTDTGPRVSGIVPQQGIGTQETSVVITGQNFDVQVHTDFAKPASSNLSSDFKVSLVPSNSKIPATQLKNIQLQNAQTLSAVIPTGLANDFYSIQVTDPVGRTASLSEVYRVVDDASQTSRFQVVGSLGPQNPKVPFEVQIRAVDGSGNSVDGFVGNVTVSDLTGTLADLNGHSGAFSLGPFVLGYFRTQLSVAKFTSVDRIVIQANGLSGQSNDFSVVSGLATQLVFTSGASHAIAQVNRCSSAISLEVQDSFGFKAPLANDINIQVVAAPPSGFTAYSDLGCSQPVTRYTLPAAVSDFSLYFKSSTIGTAFLHLIPDVLPLASQTLTVTP